jgi:phage shock protein A
MWKVVKRWWKYLAMKLHVRHEENADPKVQLEQAIQEAKERHQQLTEQAANVIANQKQAQVRLERAVDAYEKADASARQALLLADQEGRSGNADNAAHFEETAEVFANKVLETERRINELEEQLLQATSAAEGAKAAVMQNSAIVQRKLAEREQLLSTLDQAHMQEALNKAMQTLTSTIADDVPTFEEVRKKIDVRLTRAQSIAELTGAQVSSSVDAHMLEVERAPMSAVAQSRLAEMRLALGLAPPLRALGEGGREGRREERRGVADG